MANQYLPFCPTTTGSNLLNNSEYSVDAQRDVGNQPGVARSKLVNKALRQANMITSQLGQLISDSLGVDVLDQDGYESTILRQMEALTARIPSIIRIYTSIGAGTHNMSYVFFIQTGSATAGATYTNNTVTFTVSETITSQDKVIMTGNGDPLAQGTLTKTSGSGDSTLTFFAFRKPIQNEIIAVGGGGGGGGSGTGGSVTSGGNAGDTTFGTLLLLAEGGFGGGYGTGGGGGGSGAAGGASINSPAYGFVIGGGGGGAGSNVISSPDAGGSGGSSCFGGAGSGGTPGITNSSAGATNSGSGGGGAGSSASASSAGGGGSGGCLHAFIDYPISSYAFEVAGGGTAGDGGTGNPGAAGGSGIIIVKEHF